MTLTSPDNFHHNHRFEEHSNYDKASNYAYESPSMHAFNRYSQNQHDVKGEHRDHQGPEMSGTKRRGGCVQSVKFKSLFDDTLSDYDELNIIQPRTPTKLVDKSSGVRGIKKDSKLRENTNMMKNCKIFDKSSRTTMIPSYLQFESAKSKIPRRHSKKIDKIQESSDTYSENEEAKYNVKSNWIDWRDDLSKKLSEEKKPKSFLSKKFINSTSFQDDQIDRVHETQKKISQASPKKLPIKPLPMQIPYPYPMFQIPIPHLFPFNSSNNSTDYLPCGNKYTIHESADAIQKIKSELEVVKKREEELVKREESLAQEFKEVSIRNSQLLKDIEASKNESLRIKKEYEEEIKRNNDSNERISVLKNQLEKQNETVITLENKVEQLRKIEPCSECSKWDAELKIYRQKLWDEREAYRISQEECEKLKSKVEDYRKEIDLLKGNNTDLSNKIENTKERNSHEIQSIQDKNDSLNSDLHSLRQQLKSTEVGLMDSVGQIRKLQKRYDRDTQFLEERNSQLEEKLNKLERYVVTIRDQQVNYGRMNPGLFQEKDNYCLSRDIDYCNGINSEMSIPKTITQGKCATSSLNYQVADQSLTSSNSDRAMSSNHIFRTLKSSGIPISTISEQPYSHLSSKEHNHRYKNGDAGRNFPRTGNCNGRRFSSDTVLSRNRVNIRSGSGNDGMDHITSCPFNYGPNSYQIDDHKFGENSTMNQGRGTNLQKYYSGSAHSIPLKSESFSDVELAINEVDENIRYKSEVARRNGVIRADVRVDEYPKNFLYPGTRQMYQSELPSGHNSTKLTKGHFNGLYSASGSVSEYAKPPVLPNNLLNLQNRNSSNDFYSASANALHYPCESIEVLKHSKLKNVGRPSNLVGLNSIKSRLLDLENNVNQSNLSGLGGDKSTIRINNFSQTRLNGINGNSSSEDQSGSLTNRYSGYSLRNEGKTDDYRRKNDKNLSILSFRKSEDVDIPIKDEMENNDKRSHNKSMIYGDYAGKRYLSVDNVDRSFHDIRLK